MPIVPISPVGQKGVSFDTSPLILPPDVWTDCNNVRFNDNSVEKIDGHTKLYSTALDNEAQGLIYWNRPTTSYYIYGEGPDVFRRDQNGSQSDIVPSGVTYNANGVWEFSNFNGGYTIVANNGIDTPAYITYGNSGDADETTLQDLPDWPADTTAQVIRGHRNALIAGNLEFTDPDSNVISPMAGTIRVSSQAAPGALPSSWTVGASLTTTADEFELATSSPVVEIVDLRTQAMIFTETSIHTLTLSQGTGPTVVQNLNHSRGCLATGCAVEVDGNVFVMSADDIYITAGSGGIQSIAHGKVQHYLIDNLNGTHKANSFVQHNPRNNEVWFCFPSLDSTGECDVALIFNYNEKHWTKRELPRVRAATLGPYYGTDENTNRMVMGSYDGTDAYLQVFDEGNTFDGDEITAFVERERLSMGSLEATKWNGSLYPQADGTGTLDIYVDGTGNPGQMVTLTSMEKKEFSLSDDYKVDPRQNGRFLNIRFQSEDSADWRLSGYSVTVDENDRR